jgi:hypothetical protein
MNKSIYGILNIFFCAGLSSALTGSLAIYFDTLIAAIIWSYPITTIFPIIEMNRSGIKNSKIAKFMKKQSYTIFLMLIWIYATSCFVEELKEGESLTPAIIKGTGVWAIMSVIYFVVVRYILSNFGESTHSA